MADRRGGNKGERVNKRVYPPTKLLLRLGGN
jgi:hypothetical protein